MIKELTLNYSVTVHTASLTAHTCRKLSCSLQQCRSAQMMQDAGVNERMTDGGTAHIRGRFIDFR